MGGLPDRDPPWTGTLLDRDPPGQGPTLGQRPPATRLALIMFGDRTKKPLPIAVRAVALNSKTGGKLKLKNSLIRITSNCQFLNGQSSHFWQVAYNVWFTASQLFIVDTILKLLEG